MVSGWNCWLYVYKVIHLQFSSWAMGYSSYLNNIIKMNWGNMFIVCFFINVKILHCFTCFFIFLKLKRWSLKAWPKWINFSFLIKNIYQYYSINLIVFLFLMLYVVLYPLSHGDGKASKYSWKMKLKKWITRTFTKLNKMHKVIYITSTSCINNWSRYIF